MENLTTTTTATPDATATAQPTSGWDVCNHDSPYNDSPEAIACREMILAKPWCSDETSCAEKAFDGDPNTPPSEGTFCGAWPENDLCSEPATPTVEWTATATETLIATYTPTAEQTATATPTATGTPTETATATPTATGTPTEMATVTPTIEVTLGTPTPPAEWTATPTATSTKAPTAEIILQTTEQAPGLNAPTGGAEHVYTIGGVQVAEAALLVTVGAIAANRKRIRSAVNKVRQNRR